MKPQTIKFGWVILEIDSGIPAEVREKIYQGVSEEDKRKNIKTLHANSIRGEVIEGQENDE